MRTNHILCTLLLLLSLSSCDDLDWNDDYLVTTTVPHFGWSSGSVDNHYVEYFNPDIASKSPNGIAYFAFSFSSDDKVNRGVFNFLTYSRKDAKRIADLLSSGRWLSEEEPYPLPINVADYLLYCDVNEWNGIIGYRGPLKYVLQNWYGNKQTNYNQSINFGRLKLLNAATAEYLYATSIIFGMKCRADLTSKVNLIRYPDGSSEKELVLTLSFEAPTVSMATFLGHAIKESIYEQNEEPSVSISEKNVVITLTVTRSNNFEAYAKQQMYFFDSFLHQPMQCLVLEHKDFGVNR